MLEIKDIKLLKITKVKTWAIYFTYDNESYLLHESTLDYESTLTLYKRNLTEHGRYDLEVIKSSGSNSFSAYYYLDIRSEKPVYSQIDLELFCKKMTRDEFFCGIYEEDVKKMRERVGFINEDNRLHEKCIRRNNDDKRRILRFEM